MDFGLVLQTDPPARRVVDLTRRAETLGFSHAYTFDSHILWQEPYVIYAQMLAATERMVVGPMVTNPGTRDWTVTASLFATLNDTFGERTVCGIGRGDSAMRVIGHRPCSLATLAEAMAVIKGLAEGREVTYNDMALRIPCGGEGSLRSGWRPTGRGPWRCAGHRPTASSCSSPTWTSPPGPSARCGPRPPRLVGTRRS